MKKRKSQLKKTPDRFYLPESEVTPSRNYWRHLRKSDSAYTFRFRKYSVSGCSDWWVSASSSSNERWARNLCVFNWDILVSCENISQVRKRVFSIVSSEILENKKTCCLSRQRIFLSSYRGLFLRCPEWSLIRKVNSSPMNYSGGCAEKVRWVVLRYFAVHL